jgi:hypothetical protein
MLMGQWDTLYKITIIPMIPWSFSRAGFHINSDDLLASLTINRTEVLARISVPEISLEQLISQEATEAPASPRVSSTERANPGSDRIRGEFAGIC